MWRARYAEKLAAAYNVKSGRRHTQSSPISTCLPARMTLATPARMKAGGHARDDQEVAMDGHTISLNLALDVLRQTNRVMRRRRSPIVTMTSGRQPFASTSQAKSSNPSGNSISKLITGDTVVLGTCAAWIHRRESVGCSVGTGRLRRRSPQRWARGTTVANAILLVV